ncbi:hypothetical protein Pmani_024017 [Petrolisthes manimaculis]|uniref:Uncharacterized protein n=1 Tax=Petrolisthes manimaculis TaxID=1843537 RepID=A0AAE1NED9_9EUCA|nr:hypothetical protein Pmani_039320 [Petrolisthes manimaculis]KAK4304014.1 hypothetical protein Pmani_024017 [Petrolisthes manimaculis]
MFTNPHLSQPRLPYEAATGFPSFHGSRQVSGARLLHLPPPPLTFTASYTQQSVFGGGDVRLWKGVVSSTNQTTHRPTDRPPDLLTVMVVICLALLIPVRAPTNITTTAWHPSSSQDPVGTLLL